MKSFDEIGRIWSDHNVHELLVKKYKEEINQNWHFDQLDFEESEDFDGFEEDGNFYLTCFIGTVFQIMPSGKYYMLWTTNQTLRDVEKDSAFMEALEDILSERKMWIESGEGDPCDMFICKNI